MNIEENIRNKIYNITLVVDDVKKFPQTYQTILGCMNKDGTCQLILRRKLNKLCKDGTIFRTSIPGTRFGKAIFYHSTKKYFIVVEAGRAGSNVYYFFNSERQGKYHLKIKPCWLLENGVWVEKKEYIIFEGNVLKYI